MIGGAFLFVNDGEKNRKVLRRMAWEMRERLGYGAIGGVMDLVYAYMCI